ncbi:GntR family transcriptional regulator [Ureibacillus massiliensis 4400831 = CIP 108448 = CCUG 49529]|uniref:GntR family transcriptional regulator n=1 Tax=Ureibacillus massiliensis 4400831 = CIP 108448 = CCUG 49529 TaxID=1211035 RepID=A0A0A3IY87_9BACL|nr:FadR/GntR family transcriptional regulator [Ureibacillus massiliensis]KGR89686.1 GntR family transcriptional regulator [Ureibacillus massiliensis 4400831 = CIP 108448 = CCUG 49529]
MTSNSSFSKVPRRKLADVVLEQLQQRIFSGSYKVGDRLPPEPQLMEELGVGRSTLREVIQVLVHAGILEVKQGQGTHIISLEEKTSSFEDLLAKSDIQHVYEARAMLDKQVAELASKRRTNEDMLILKSFLDQRKRMLQEGNYNAYIEADVQFHLAIAKASHNPILESMYSAFIPTLRQILSKLILNTVDYQDNTLYHEKLYQAILNQNVKEAVEIISKNLER